MCISLHVKCPLFLSDFNQTWIFVTYFFKNTQISNFMNIRPVGTEFHADGQTETDRHEEGTQQSLFAILRTRLKTKALEYS
jgi:hypothetical protein